MQYALNIKHIIMLLVVMGRGVLRIYKETNIPIHTV